MMGVGLAFQKKIAIFQLVFVEQQQSPAQKCPIEKNVTNARIWFKRPKKPLSTCITCDTLPI